MAVVEFHIVASKAKFFYSNECSESIFVILYNFLIDNCQKRAPFGFQSQLSWLKIILAFVNIELGVKLLLLTFSILLISNQSLFTKGMPNFLTALNQIVLRAIKKSFTVIFLEVKTY